MASNSSTTSPPPESSTSQTSPPPPPSGDNPSPPPPSDSSPPPSTPPPPSPSVTPLPPPPPPAEDDQQYSPPPPPAQGDDQQYSPPPPPSPNSNNGSSPYRPPPPPHQSNQFSPPPPVHHQLSSPKSSSSSNSNTSSSSSSNSSGDQLGLAGIIGIATGGGLLLLLVILLVFTSSRKKKRSQTTTIHYYPSQHGAPADNNNNNNVEYFKRHEVGTQNHHQYVAAAAAGYNNNNNGEHHVVNILPPPPGNWGLTHHQYPQAQSTAEMSCSSSSCYSGSSSHGPALPPPHPTVALGFNQSSFTFQELSTATAGFAQRNLLGQGGFGYVHKGVLPNGKEIAVKSLKSTGGGGGQGDREFQAEVDIISRVHHKHLVSLVGYCMSETLSQKLLVYEFVPNKTLDYHLHGKGPVMDWATRLKIATGICKGLAYLHEDCHPRIIHRDIKGPNILIENNFEAKVADFGLAKITQDANTHVSTRVMGTFGYLAPEYASTGKLTDKSDVFSYGVMLLELITGRRPVDTTGDLEDESLVDWARPLCVKAMENGIFEGLVDARLEDNYEKHEMSRMVACAAAAVRHSSRRRPKMSHIVRVLEGDASLEILNHEGVKRPGQSSVVLSSSSSSNDYSADMKKLKKLTLDSSSNNMMISSEFGGTSEYGLNLSISSSDLSSTEYGGFRTGGGSRMQTP